MRKKILAANWKMNLSLHESKHLLERFHQELPNQNSLKYVVFSPTIFLHSLNKENGKIALGAQNFYPAEKGAFTGETSVSQLLDAHVTHVLIGHSERRLYFKESNNFLKEKVDCARQHNLNIMFCCGESLETRDDNQHLNFVKSQLEESLFHLSEEDFLNCSIAYEPIWAIGTGRTANENQIEEMHYAIRNRIEERYSKSVADSTSILYGGSCNGSNAESIFSCPNVDGGLIGGASLKYESFLEIAIHL